MEFRRQQVQAAAFCAARRRSACGARLRAISPPRSCADSGFDWLLLDTEHSPNEVPDILRHLQAVQGGSASPVVRVAWNDAVLIKRILDVGAQTILVPYVQNAEEARQRGCRRALSAGRHPRRDRIGARQPLRPGEGLSEKGRCEVAVLVQVETREALAELEAIAAVDGVDGVFIGPSDLSASFGLIGQPLSPDDPAEIEKAGGKLRTAGKAAGILAGSVEDSRRYIDWGYTFVAAGVDTVLLARAADDLAAKMKQKS